MRLKVLDLRENRITDIFQKEATAFLKETVVFLWDNPFSPEALKEISREYNDPMHLFRATNEFEDDFRQILNPLHIYQPLDSQAHIMQMIEEF